MKELLQKFSPEISSVLVGDDVSRKKIYPKKSEKVFDLHGYFESEISGRMDFIYEFSQEKKYSRIKIITGIGKKILFSAVQKNLKIFLSEGKILRFEEGDGMFDVFF